MVKNLSSRNRKFGYLWDGRRLTCYQFRSERLLPVSTDDSLVIQALEKRWLTAAKAESIDQAESLKGFNKIETGLFKSRNIITQALGLGLIKPRIGSLTPSQARRSS